MNYRSLVIVNFFLIYTIIFAITASETRKGRPPLIGDGNKKKHRRRSECQFGKRSYELEQTWHPDLGPPFGVMYCIRCECMAVQKKRRITGRTVCKNVKNECPKITCKEPILPAGHCCKICPEEGKEFSLLKEDTFAGYEEDDKSGKDFAGVLVGPLSMQPTFSTAVGSVRLSAHRRNLHYSVTVTPDFKPKGIQFMNDEGTVLEEQEINDNEYKEATGKVCGAWRRIPRIYRHLLRNEKLWFAIVSEEGAILSTAPLRHRSLASEVLSALLVPLDPSAVGAGGTAVVSMSSTSNSVHITLIVSGLMQHEKKEADSTLVVSLVASKSEDGEQRVIEQLFSVQKAQDVATIEIRTVLEPHELKQLTRSQVTITVYSKRFPAAKISGIIETRITCDVFDSILEPSNEETKTHGIAWLYLSKDGALNYRVFMNSINSASTVSIEAIQSKGKKKRIVQELSLMGNWANGTTGRLTPRDLEALYAGELGLRVDEENDTLILQGKIMVHAVTESYFDLSTGPTLLLSSNGGKLAVAWLSVDPSDCSVHYDVQVKFHKKKGESQVVNVLELVEAPRPVTSLTHSGKSYLPTSIILSSGTEVENGVLLLSPNVRLLEEFSSVQVDNTITDLSALTLARMETGGTFLKLTESGAADDPRYELQGRIKTVKVPSKCLPHYSKASIMSEETGDSPLGPGYVLDEGNEIPKVPRCLYEGRLYEEGAQWTAEHSQCTMCSCQRGRTVCDPIVCPILKCDKIMQVGGDCCPVCKNMTSPKVPSSMKSCYFEGDKKYYSAGTKWHPYLPPFGFDKCALCSCNAGTLKVECTRLTCPEPQCPESDRYRPDPKSCCQECRIPEPTQPTKNYENDGEQDEEAQAKSDADVLAAGGCRFKGEMFENGSEWNPRILPWGAMKCINCNCKDGRVKCKRRKCIKNRCVAGTRQMPDECCPPCAHEKLKRSKRKKTKRRRTLVRKQ